MKIELTYGEWFDKVEVNGQPLTPERSLAVANHSPDGFAWGYGGSGPAQLALALLLEAGLSDNDALRLHQQFKDQFVAQWPQRGSALHYLDVEAWVCDHLPEPDAETIRALDLDRRAQVCENCGAASRGAEPLWHEPMCTPEARRVVEAEIVAKDRR